MKKSLFILVCLSVLTYTNAQTEFNINASGTNINSEIEISELNDNPIFLDAKRARTFNLNPELLGPASLQIGDQIDMPLFQDRKFEGTLQDKVTQSENGTTLTIKLTNFKYAYAYLTTTSNSYLLYINIPELNESYKTYAGIPYKDVFLIENDPKIYKDYNCGVDEFSEQLKTQNTKEPNASTTNQLINPSETCLTLPPSTVLADIHILFVYTPEAETYANANNGGITNTINLALAEANQVAAVSNIGINFQAIPSSYKVDYTENSAGADLSALRDSTDPYMNEVHDLRKTHNADLVCLFSYLPGDGIGGIANLLNTRYGNPTTGFSNIKVNAAFGNFTAVHEWSHNMGAMHSHEQNDAPGPTSWIDWSDNTWSSGWRGDGNNGVKYSTIMTYSAAQYYDPQVSSIRIGYLSNPDINYEDVPIGSELLENNAKTLREVKHEVSRYNDYAQYCIAGTKRTSAYSISNVIMGTINNSSSNSFYADYSGLGTCMDPGETQTLTVDVNASASTRYLAIWIDWNDNKEFEPSELEYNGLSSQTQHILNVTAPLGFSAGNKRMRLRTYDTSTGGFLSPCGYFTSTHPSLSFSEVEDYTIYLGEAGTCTIGTTPVFLDNPQVQGSVVKLDWFPVEGVEKYELRYRKTGDINWINVDNIVYPYYELTNLELETEYEAQVRAYCQDVPSNYTTSKVFNSGGYCASSGTDPNIYISRINVGNMNNTSDQTTYTYSDYTDLVANLEKGSTYTIIVENPSGPPIAKGYRVWIDYNYNGDFDDPGELILDQPPILTESVNQEFTVPIDAYLGKVRMRASLRMYQSPPSCGDFLYGEVEDYSVNITLPPLSNDEFIMDNITIYPNPFKDAITLKLPSSALSNKLQLQLFDITGKKVHHQKLRANDTKIQISDLNNLVNGIYFLEITNLETQHKTMRKIIKH